MSFRIKLRFHFGTNIFSDTRLLLSVADKVQRTSFSHTASNLSSGIQYSEMNTCPLRHGAPSGEQVVEVAGFREKPYDVRRNFVLCPMYGIP